MTRGRQGDFRVRLGLIAAAALVLRVVAVLRWSRFLPPEGDQLFYLRQAQALGEGYGFVYRDNAGALLPTAVHPPLYSAYLGLLGPLHLSADSHAPYRLATALVGVATVVLVGLAARRVAGPRAGLIAAGIAAVYPNLWINDVMLVSEAVYAATIAAVLLAAYRFRDDPRPGRAGVLGATVALATLARAEAVALFVLLLVPLALLARGIPGRDRWRCLGAGAVVGAVVLAPWIVRNAVTFETHPLTVSNGSGFVLEISNCDQTYGYAPPLGADGLPAPGQPADAKLGYWSPECDRTPWPPGDETVVDAAKRRTGLDYIDAHRTRFPVVVAARVGRIWDLWRPVQSRDFNVFFERRGDWPTVAAMAVYYPLLVASIGGLVVLWRRRVTIVPFVAVFLSTTLTAAVSFGITRYRVGSDVALAVLGGVALDAAWRALRSRHRAGGTEGAEAAGPAVTGAAP